MAQRNEETLKADQARYDKHWSYFVGKVDKLGASRVSTLMGITVASVNHLVSHPDHLPWGTTITRLERMKAGKKNAAPATKRNGNAAPSQALVEIRMGEAVVSYDSSQLSNTEEAPSGYTVITRS